MKLTLQHNALYTVYAQLSSDSDIYQNTVDIITCEKVYADAQAYLSNVQ